MPDIILFDIGVVIASAAILSLVAYLFRQPLIPAYILAGIIIGPFGLGIITNYELISNLSELGIAFLLFIVAMELDLSRLQDVSFVSAFGAVTQMLFIFSIGFFAAFSMGFTSINALYIGMILAFSSTMVVIKILSERNEVETLHGRIVLGFLLIQDVVVVIVLSVLSGVADFSLNSLMLSLLKGVGLFSIAIVASKYIIPPLIKKITKNPEVLFLVSLSISFFFGAMAHLAGFSIAVGGFLAGISLAVFPYNLEIIGRVSSLRDFFATMFFVSLGMQIVLTGITSLLVPSFVFTVIALIIKPVIITILVLLLGYELRTSFLSGISLAQISEFSLIVAGTGLALGHIGPDIFTITTLVAILTITMTPYFIRSHSFLYRKFAGFFHFFEGIELFHKKRKLHSLPADESKNVEHVILCGAHVMGQTIIEMLQKTGRHFLVVDYNPEVVKKLIDRRIHSLYGDIKHVEVLKRLHLDKAQLVISTIPDTDDNILLIGKTKEVNPRAKIFVTANDIDAALLLYDEGADYVIMPKMLSGEKISKFIEQLFDRRVKPDIEGMKKREIIYLEERKEREILQQYSPDFLKDLKRKVVRG